MKHSHLKIMVSLIVLFTMGIVIGGCSKGNVKGETIRILSGSENKELEPVLEECEKKTGVKIEMTY